MNKKITFSYLFLVFSLLNTPLLFAQPSNDNPCDAITLNFGVGPLTINNQGATSPPEEEAIVPPTASYDAFGNCVGGWCDFTGIGGGAGIDHSVWFKFTAPFDIGIFVDLCSSTFDSQLALYQVGDCADYETFNYIYATDDQVGCGNFPDANGDGQAEINLASSLLIECLNGGEEYYLLVDAWQTPSLEGFIEGDIVISIDEQHIDQTGPTAMAEVISPNCPGDANGSVDVTMLGGIPPITYLWSNASTTQDITGLVAGTYNLTITDFCGSTKEYEYVLEDSIPIPISLGMFDNTFTNSLTCTRQGSISLPVVSGTPPFTYEWNDGATSAYRDNLADGVYTVTISDACAQGGATLVQEFTVETMVSNNIPTAGPDVIADVTSNNTCAPIQIGFDNDSGLEESTFKVTDNKDQIPAGNIHCRFLDPPFVGMISQSRHWRSFDLTNYKIPNGSTLAGVEVFVRCIANSLSDSTNTASYQPGLPVRFFIGKTNTLALDAANLDLTGIDTVDVFIPSTGIFNYVSYFVPFPKANNINGNDQIVISVETFGQEEFGHFFSLGANESVVDNAATTYLSGCELPGIVKLEDIDPAFADETIVNLIWNGDGDYTYEWNGDVDDATAATPMALGTSGGIYTVTITDPCGEEFTDEVIVDCFIESTEELAATYFTISPNPSTGVFQLTKDGGSRELLVQIFDLHGKLVHKELMNSGSGAPESLDLSDLAKGIYLAKLSEDNVVEAHRLIIH